MKIIVIGLNETIEILNKYSKIEFSTIGLP